MAKPSLMDQDLRFRTCVAEGIVNGRTGQEIIDELEVLTGRTNIHKDTITDYNRHPAVRAIAEELGKDRGILITSAIDKRLEDAIKCDEPIDIKTLLEIRKALGGEKLTIAGNLGDGSSSTLTELFEHLDQHPEDAEKVMAAQEAAARGAE